MNFVKCIQVVKSVNKPTVRGYAFKSDLKIKWNRPEKIPCIKPEKSGDLSKLPPIDPTELVLKYRDSKELMTADETVKSLFQLQNNRNALTSSVYRNMFIKDVQRHPLDFGSMEAKLAKMTATIRRYQDQMEQFPRDKRTKVELKELIDKRKKFLKYLRRWDYKRFEWLLEKLDLVYKPPPNEFHWITRKDSLRKLTDTHCENVKQQRLEEYRSSLEKQQIPFLEEKIKNLEFVRKEQQECQVAVTVSQEEINAVKKQLEELRKAREQFNAPSKS